MKTRMTDEEMVRKIDNILNPDDRMTAELQLRQINALNRIADALEEIQADISAEKAYKPQNSL